MNTATTSLIVRFAALSLALHALALASWTTASLPKPRLSAALSVGFAPPTARPAKSATKAPATKTKPVKTTLRRSVRSQPLPTVAQARPVARSRQRVAPAVKQPARTKGGVVATSPSTREQTAALRTVRRSDVVVTKGSAGETHSPPKKTSPLTVSPPMASRPWEAVWGSIRSYTPAQPLAEVSTPAPLTAPAARTEYPALAAVTEAKLSEPAQARIRGRLQTDLSRYFSYPSLARRRGWEGHVGVQFTVQPDGRLTDVRVTRSSGYHVLDQSALAALRKVGQLAEARHWLNGESVTVELPVIYRLEK